MKLIIFLLIKTIFNGSRKLENNNEIECSRELPLFLKSENRCVFEYYEEEKHEISNRIIKTKW